MAFGGVEGVAGVVASGGVSLFEEVLGGGVGGEGWVVGDDQGWYGSSWDG